MGPNGSPYQGGLFHVEIKIPVDYPNAPPAVSFKTQIEHCNILQGVPCPNLLFSSWAPALTIRSVLLQLVELLKEQKKGDALRPELAALEPDAFAALARKSTATHATPQQQFVQTPPKTSPTEAISW